MKALLIYSHNTGANKKGFANKLSYVLHRLATVFETLDPVCTLSKEEARRLIIQKGNDYDSLIVIGGDGTFNNALNSLMSLENKPTIGYLNFGTVGDVGKAFGLKNDFKKDVEIIVDQNIKEIDVGKLKQDQKTYYFAYTCSIGAYSDIPYVVERRKKRRVGKLAYYEKAVGEAFKKKIIKYTAKVDGSKEVSGASPFIMFLNGTHMAGFKINKECSYDDGEFELYLTEEGPFNGLLHYVPFKNIEPLLIKKCEITVPKTEFWCLDGENGPAGEAVVEVCPKAIKIYTNRH